MNRNIRWLLDFLGDYWPLFLLSLVGGAIFGHALSTIGMWVLTGFLMASFSIGQRAQRRHDDRSLRRFLNRTGWKP